MAEPQTIDPKMLGSPVASFTPPSPQDEGALSVNPNMNREKAVDFDSQKVYMDKESGHIFVMDKDIGDRQAEDIIQQSYYSNPSNFKPGVYEKVIKPAIDTGGANLGWLENPGFVSEAMGKNALQALTMNIYKPSPDESRMFNDFAHNPSIIGQFAGMTPAVIGGGYLAKTALGAAMTIPGVAPVMSNIFTGTIAKLGLEGAIKAGQVASAATVSGTTMSMYNAISEAQNQLKDNDERVKNGEDPVPLDYGKIVGDSAKQGAMFALVGGIGAQIAKPLVGMTALEATGQVAKDVAVSAGSMWAIAKAQGSSDEDAGLMATVAAALHLTGVVDSVKERQAMINATKYAIADHIQQSNMSIDPNSAYEIGKGIVDEHIQDAKPISNTEPAPETPEVRKNAEQYSEEDIGDIHQMWSWEKDQQPGGMVVSGGRQTGPERNVIYSTSGHSDAMQDVGPQEAFRLMEKAMSGDKLIKTEPEKLSRLLNDFRDNVKPNINDDSFRIASNPEATGEMMKNLAQAMVDPADMKWLEEQPAQEPQAEELPVEEAPVNPMTGGMSMEEKFGSHNTVFTEDVANAARESLREKMAGLHSGVDPTAIGDLAKIGGYYFEGGLRDFAEWSKKMVDEFGDAIKPYLKDTWNNIQTKVKDKPVETDLAKQEYFPLKPLGLTTIEGRNGEDNLKKTGEDIRKRYLGSINEQIVRVHDLADDIRGLEKDKTQQQAQSIYASFGGDLTKLKEAIAKADALPDDDYNKEYWNSEVKPAAEAALNLSEGAKEGIKLGNQYFRESGAAMREVGAIRSVLENYGINRLYQDEPVERAIKGNDYDNPQQSTHHAKQRYYENMIDAVIGGKRFKTMNYPDLIGVHGEEAAYVVKGRQFAQESVPIKMGGWTDTDSVPAGWKQIGNMKRDIPMKDNGVAVIGKDGNQEIKHQVFVAPAAIAEQLDPLTDPDNLRKINAVQKASAINNAVKAFNVMIGAFHDKQFILQKLASKGGLKGLKDTFSGQLSKLMETPDFKEARLDMVSTGVGTSNKIMDNIDVLKNVNNPGGADGSWLKKIVKLPVVKQAADMVEWHRHNLFEVMGEYFKVDNYRRELAAWDLKNPDATDDQRLEAKRGIAQASNNTFGGHNWAGLGIAKSSMTAARNFWFAPDWLYSAYRTGKSAVTDWKGINGSQGTEGVIARATVIKGFLYGTAATQMANYMINGHFTDKNTKGHKMEIEISPNNHFSLYAAGTGEILKLYSDIAENGPLTGTGRYLQGKVSPIMRLIATAISHTSYAGQDITKETGGIGKEVAKVVPEEYRDAVTKQVNYAVELASTVAPVPFVLQPGAFGYVADQAGKALQGQPADIAGSATLATGLSRFSKGESEARKSQDIDAEVSAGLAKGDETAANKYIESGDLSQTRLDELKTQSQLSPIEKQYKHLGVEKIINKANDDIDSMDASDQEKLKDLLQEKYDRMQSDDRASPNEIKRVGELLDDFYRKHKIK